MKASELIKRLQELIEQYGDKDVLPTTDDSNLDSVEYHDDIDSFWWD